MCATATLAGTVVLATVTGQPAPTPAAAATPTSTHTRSATGDSSPLDTALPPTPAGSPNKPVSTPSNAAPPVTTTGGTGIPAIVLDAYRFSGTPDRPELQICTPVGATDTTVALTTTAL